MHDGRKWFTATLSSILFIPLTASAQLQPTSWGEFIRIRWSCCNNQDWVGQDPASPEPLIHSLASPASSIEGSLTFEPPGPPFVIAHSEGHQFSYFYENYNGGTTQGAVTFQLRIIERTPPPVVVGHVPLVISIQGSVEALGVLGASGSAVASMRIMKGSILVFGKSTEANTSGDPGPILLNANSTVPIQPGVVLDGSVNASVVIWLLYNVGAQIEATASVGPAFEITSDFIPGTNSSFRDYYGIEYSPGYFNQTTSVPVSNTTWGKIKSRYSNDE